MTKFWGNLRNNSLLVLGALIASLLIGTLMLYKVGGLLGGLSYNELLIIKAPYGFYDLLSNPLNLHIDTLRSIIFYIVPDHGLAVSRLPNAIIGGLAIVSFATLTWLWHGTRTALLTSLLFATSAWTLHVSRLASNDVLYLWALPTLLLLQILMHRWGTKPVVWYGSLITWSLMLFIPGIVWLVALQLLIQRNNLKITWRESASNKRLFFSILSVLIWFPMLIYGFTKNGVFIEWLGFSSDFPGLMLIKQFAEVFENIIIRGPQNPDLWLGNTPIFDILTLITAGLGIYFYAKNWKASRSRTLGALMIASIILVTLGGSFSLSAVIALLYVCVAAGLAYLLQEWLKVFPKNPLARFVGISLVTIAVILSCTYNLRSYFIAFPNYKTTESTFRYHL